MDTYFHLLCGNECLSGSFLQYLTLFDLCLTCRHVNGSENRYNGNVEDATEKVNDLNPEILGMNPKLFFYLRQNKYFGFERYPLYRKSAVLLN